MSKLLKAQLSRKKSETRKSIEEKVDFSFPLFDLIFMIFYIYMQKIRQFTDQVSEDSYEEAFQTLKDETNPEIQNIPYIQDNQKKMLYF